MNLIQHPEFADVWVNLETHKLVYSVDRVNDYVYDFDRKYWAGTEVDMGFDLGIDLSHLGYVNKTNTKKVSEAEQKECYLSDYCSYNEELGKWMYTVKDANYGI